MEPHPTLLHAIHQRDEIITELQSRIDNIEIRLEDLHSKYVLLDDFNRLAYNFMVYGKDSTPYVVQPNLDLFQLGVEAGKLEGIDGLLESILTDIKKLQKEIKCP